MLKTEDIKIGQRVKFIGEGFNGVKPGQLGTVIDIDPSRYGFKVQWDDKEKDASFRWTYGDNTAFEKYIPDDCS